MKRINALALCALLCLLPTLGAQAAQPPTDILEDTAMDHPLAFPVEAYTEQTLTVYTSDGAREVAYRLYEDIPYVARPVDAAHQSLRVKVPTAVDGAPVDAANAPILFANSVGGYLSSSAGGSGRSTPDGMPPEGFVPRRNPDLQGARSPDLAGGISPGTDLALAAGLVVVEPGCRGRDNQAADGTYYGKAPAAIVDLKAAVAYLHLNNAVMPGDAERILSTGVSAGGALSALLGASGNSDLYAPYLEALGAADARTDVFAAACFCPITDLEHADMAYEWMFGAAPMRDGTLVDQELSEALAAQFAAYQQALDLQGRDDFGPLHAGNYGDYLLDAYLIPSANLYLGALSDADRDAYLAENPWIDWTGGGAAFAFDDYVAHAGRTKGLPAFDAFDLSTAENSLFGDADTNARHFTEFSLREATGDAEATVPEDVQHALHLMNPMSLLAQGLGDSADHWWIRHGSMDSDTSLPVIINLATQLENLGKAVDTRLYWDAGHGADEDPEAFIEWILALCAR